MGRRLDLDSQLRSLLGSDNVYFQPPESIVLKYPCIIYKRESNDVKFADGAPYAIRRKYSLLLIDRNPDTTLPDTISALPLCKPGSFYQFENLNHYPFTIYY